MALLFNHKDRLIQHTSSAHPQAAANANLERLCCKHTLVSLGKIYRDRTAVCELETTKKRGIKNAQ